VRSFLLLRYPTFTSIISSIFSKCFEGSSSARCDQSSWHYFFFIVNRIRLSSLTIRDTSTFITCSFLWSLNPSPPPHFKTSHIVKCYMLFKFIEGLKDDKLHDLCKVHWAICKVSCGKALGVLFLGKRQLVCWLHVLSWLPTTDSWWSIVVLTFFNHNLARFSSLNDQPYITGVTTTRLSNRTRLTSIIGETWDDWIYSGSWQCCYCTFDLINKDRAVAHFRS
jgi:hypothetical protein